VEVAKALEGSFKLVMLVPKTVREMTSGGEVQLKDPRLCCSTAKSVLAAKAINLPISTNVRRSSVRTRLPLPFCNFHRALTLRLHSVNTVRRHLPTVHSRYTHRSSTVPGGPLGRDRI